MMLEIGVPGSVSMYVSFYAVEKTFVESRKCDFQPSSLQQPMREDRTEGEGERKGIPIANKKYY